jgi:hypothetical protein
MSAKVFAKVVKDINPRLIEQLKERLGQNGQVVKVGLPDGVKDDSGAVDLTLVGSVHEFGSPARGIPERPFLRTAIRENKSDYNRLNKINFVKMIKGDVTANQALQMLGVMAVAHVKKKIRTGPFAPLKPSTIAAKGSSTPLIDSGQMVQNITYELGTKE